MGKPSDRKPEAKPSAKTKNMTTLRTDSLILIIAAAVVVGFVGGVAMTVYKTGGSASGLAGPAGPMGNPGGSPSASFSAMQEIERLEKMAAQNPQISAGWVALGNAAFDANLFEKAIQAYEIALQIDSNQPGVWTDLGVMYRRSQKPEKAKEMFEKAMEIDPKHEISRFNLGVVLMHDLKDNEGALKAWEDLLAVNPVATAPNGQSLDELIQGIRSQMEKK